MTARAGVARGADDGLHRRIAPNVTWTSRVTCKASTDAWTTMTASSP